MKMRFTAIVLICLILLTVTACTKQENTPGGSVNFGEYELPTEVEATTKYDPAGKLKVDLSWCEKYIVSYSYYKSDIGESMLVEGRCGNYLQIWDKTSGIMSYYEQEESYMLEYLLDVQNAVGTVSVVADNSVDTIAHFPALTICKEDFPLRSNVTKVGTNFVADRSATRYKQVEAENGVEKRIAYLWIDDQYGFISKCEVYNAETQELITRLEVLDFTTNVTEDAVKMKLDDYTIASQ